MTPSTFADILLIGHFVYVLCVVVPTPLIIIGGMVGWSFVRNSWFRNLHLGMIGIVVVQTLLGIFCPLTVWEDDLRMEAGEMRYGGSFIEHWIGRFLYYDFPPWVFSAIYLVYGFLVIGLYFAIPPQCLRSRSSS